MFNENLLISKDALRLQVLNEDLVSDLTNLSSDSRIWRFRPEPLYEPRVFKEKWIDKAFEQMQIKKRICYVVSVDQRMAGSSSYYDIDSENKKLSIGYTWFHPDYWGTTVNPLTKLIMLEHAFEQLGFNRVEFSVDSINIPSRKSLEKYGIKQEGILRNHMILTDGRIRDSVIYSVISQEWPEIKTRIQSLVDAL